MNKKFLLVILSIIFMLVPAELKADYQIISASLLGKHEVSSGQEIIQTFKINFDHYGKYDYALGVWDVSFKIDYDKTVLTIESVQSEDNLWINTLYQEDDEITILSIFNNEKEIDTCTDGILSCGDYTVNLKFYVKETNQTSTIITLNDISLDTYIVKNNSDYDYADTIELNTSDISKELKIETKSESNIINKESQAIIYNEKPITNTPQIKTKDSDNYLKSLIIEGHTINFSKNINDYVIVLNDKEESVVVKATPNDKNATVEIIGQDNLRENDYKVLVKVKAKNGKVNIYTITAKQLEKEIINNDSKDLQKKDNKIMVFIKKHLTYIFIGAGSILMIIIIFIIINAIENKKIDKNMNL